MKISKKTTRAELAAIVSKALAQESITCVMDRLAWFFHNNDRQCLDQAIEVAKAHPIKLKMKEKWADQEGANEKFKIFAKSLRP